MIKLFSRNKQLLRGILNHEVNQQQKLSVSNNTNRLIKCMNGYSFSDEQLNKSSKQIKNFKHHESNDQLNHFLKSKYYNDNEEGRATFMSNKMGLHRCVELKVKLEYMMRLYGKEMHQHNKLNEIISISIKFMDNMKNKFDNMNDKKQQEAVYFLRNMNELMEYMNIIDLNLWRAYFETVVLVSKKKSYNYHFTVLLGSMDKFCNRFYHKNSDSFREQVVFKQDDLPTVVTSKLINQLLFNMEKCPITDPNPKSFVLSLYYLSNIIWKVSKTPQVLISGYTRTQFFLKYQQHCINILPTIDIELAISLYYSFTASGAVNKEIVTAFNNYFISKLSQFKKNETVQDKLIDIWNISGQGSQELFDNIEQNIISNIQKNTHITQIMRYLCLSCQTNLKLSDSFIKQLINLLGQKVELVDQISNFQLESLFNILIFFKMQNPNLISQEFINSPIFDKLIQHLIQTHQIQVEQGNPKESILDLKPVVNKITQKIANQDSNKYDQEEDFNNIKNSSPGLKQEVLCYKSLLYWLNLQNLLDEFIICQNIKINLYELDLLIYSKMHKKCVAIEITGNNYSNADGSLIGKRQLKHKILTANGIDVKYFIVNEDTIYHNAISLNASRKVSRILIAEQIFKLIEDSLGYQYPKNDLKKKKFITESPSDSEEQIQNM